MSCHQWAFTDLVKLAGYETAIKFYKFRKENVDTQSDTEVLDECAQIIATPIKESEYRA